MCAVPFTTAAFKTAVASSPGVRVILIPGRTLLPSPVRGLLELRLVEEGAYNCRVRRTCGRDVRVCVCVCVCVCVYGHVRN